MMFLNFLCCAILATSALGAQSQPKIYTKDGSIHIRSGDEGNIVFEPSDQGRVFVGDNELNMTGTVGPKGDPGDTGVKGDRGEKGDSGVSGTGVKGEVGEKGQKGDRGEKGSSGSRGAAGSTGLKGDVGPQGIKGERGQAGIDGAAGVPGTNGTQGPRGAKGDPGSTSYHTEPSSQHIVCNSSTLGILRYFSSSLQLCTAKGWRNVALESPAICHEANGLNVPDDNLEAFNNANTGIMFQFNKDSSAMVSSQTNLNIGADSLPVNTTLTYQDAIMRQAAHFSGLSYLNVTGLPADFWHVSNWSIMALMKFGPGATHGEVEVLGHGTTAGNRGFHVGVSKQKAINGYYSNDLVHTKALSFYDWIHITWTSEKFPGNKERRCIFLNGAEAECLNSTAPYMGTGDTTIGSWWARPGRSIDLDIDQLTIISGVVRYTYTIVDKQLCYAQIVDSKLP